MIWKQVIAFALHSIEDSVDLASLRYYSIPGKGLVVLVSIERVL